MASDSGSKFWTVFSLGSAILAAAVAKKALNTSWRAATGKNPPANPRFQPTAERYNLPSTWRRSRRRWATRST